MHAKMHDAERLLPLLAEQMDFLRVSCERFDGGHIHEAKRIALTLRVLLYDMGSSVSLLQQLSVKADLRFLDTDARQEPDAGNVQVVHPTGWPLGLVILKLGSGAGYAPALGKAEQFRSQRPFGEWWNHVLVRSMEGEEWDRARFLIGLAHKEGGAHVDPSPEEWWRSLRDGTWAGAGTAVSPEGQELPIDSLVPAVVRQIAYEVEMTLTEQLPTLLGGPLPNVEHPPAPTNVVNVFGVSFEVPAPPKQTEK